MSETWSFLLTVLGQKNKRRAGHEAEAALARQSESLPLSAEQRALLQWFYALAPDEKDVDLRSRYRDADRLAINLFTALDRAAAYNRRVNGVEKNTAPEKKTPEPEGWQERFRKKFPRAAVPESFRELDERVQEELKAA